MKNLNKPRYKKFVSWSKLLSFSSSDKILHLKGGWGSTHRRSQKKLHREKIKFGTTNAQFIIPCLNLGNVNTGFLYGIMNSTTVHI